MPRAKKQPTDWTTEEAMKKLFPKKVRDRVKEEAEKGGKPQVSESNVSIKEDRT
jgi:hypothetical protein